MEYFQYSQIDTYRLKTIAFLAIIKDMSLIDICDHDEHELLKYDIDTRAAYQHVRTQILLSFDNILNDYLGIDRSDSSNSSKEI